MAGYVWNGSPQHVHVVADQHSPRIRLRHHEPRDDGTVPTPEAHAVDCHALHCRGLEHHDLIAPFGSHTWHLSAPCMRLIEHARELYERSEYREESGERSEPPL